MMIRWMLIVLVLFFPGRSWAAEAISVFDARPISVIVEVGGGQALGSMLQNKLLEQYQWAFRFPAYDKRAFGGPAELKKGYAPLQDQKGHVSVDLVQAYMKRTDLQRLVLLRVDVMDSFIHHDAFNDDEIEEVRVRAVATLVDQTGRILFQRKIQRWEWQEPAVDSGPGYLLLDEWERFLNGAKKSDNYM